MRIKLTASINMLHSHDIFEVIDELERHLGKRVLHDRMVMHNFFIGHGWAIDHCNDHWELRIDARTARKPWAVALRLKWA